MTTQFPDQVRYRRRRRDITAVEGTGLFHPGEHGVTTRMLSTGCWRGFICEYRIRRDRLVLAALEIHRTEGRAALVELFRTAPGRPGRRSGHPEAARFARLAWPVPFTGRLLLGAGPIYLGHLHMGFMPAWLYEQVHELEFHAGQLTQAHDRSGALAEVRRQLGPEGLRPPGGTVTADWVERTFSLRFDYSWPVPD